MRYDPRQPHANRYVRGGAPIDPALYERVRGDCLKLTEALGYDFDTLEFAVRDGIPYAIDFLNPAPDADPASIGDENFRWVLERSAEWLIERVARDAAPPERFHWQEFLAAASRPARPKSPARRPATRGRRVPRPGTPPTS
jgi:hypothetical protein